MTIAIIDCGSGNLHSVTKALDVAASAINKRVILTTDTADVRSASHVVLPGVGAFGDCMAGLHALDGIREVLEEEVHQNGKPFLGICVGMQMLFEKGMEHGEHAGLGWLKGTVSAMQLPERAKVPHMGWNNLQIKQKEHPLFKAIAEGEHVYFVHSYHATGTDAADMLATTDYYGELCACIGKNNMLGTQFHPEKSGKIGLQLLQNFCAM